MPRPITATIHLSALTHNYTIAKQHSGTAKVWAVVKANAYGHGLHLATKAFATADGLALIEVDNAIKLREMGWSKPIFLLEGFFHAEDLPQIQAHQIEITVHSIEQIDLLEKAKLKKDAGIIKVHLKVNGGMNRLGFMPADIPTVFDRLRAIKAVRVVELMMHFANADDEFNPRLSVAEQLRRFEKAQQSLGSTPIEISLSNSAATVMSKPVKDNWVRAGIMLYGGSPNENDAKALDLLPAMTLSSELIATQNIEVGESIGYGSRFVADKPMRIGIVACGYADGYPRHANDGTPMLVDGIKTRMVGRVSMDLITVDITDIPDAKVGSVATLWGQGLPVDEVARASDTIGYELMCAVAPRVRLIAED